MDPYLFRSSWQRFSDGFGDLKSFGHWAIALFTGGRWRWRGRGCRAHPDGHFLRAGETQAAKVLVSLSVNHQQSGLMFHSFDPLHHLSARESKTIGWALRDVLSTIITLTLCYSIILSNWNCIHAKITGLQHMHLVSMSEQKDRSGHKVSCCNAVKPPAAVTASALY